MAHDFSPGPDGAAQLDRLDPLAPYRQRFYYPTDTIYPDGNSLGLASRDAEAALQQVFADWQQLGVEGWTEGERAWFFLAEISDAYPSYTLRKKRMAPGCSRS